MPMTLSDIIQALNDIDVDELREELATKEREIVELRRLLALVDVDGAAPAAAVVATAPVPTNVPATPRGRKPKGAKPVIDESLPLKTRVVNHLRDHGPTSYRDLMTQCGAGPRNLTPVLNDAHTFEQLDDKTWRLKRA